MNTLIFKTSHVARHYDQCSAPGGEPSRPEASLLLPPLSMESRPATRDWEMADDDPDAEDPTIDDAADAALKAAAPGVGGGMKGGVAAADAAGWLAGE